MFGGILEGYTYDVATENGFQSFDLSELLLSFDLSEFFVVVIFVLKSTGKLCFLNQKHMTVLLSAAA